MSKPKKDIQPNGDVQFYDNYIPTLKAGNYSITVKQGLTLKKTPFRQEQEFIVKAPQFSIEPSEIHALFPMSGSKGAYGECLPQIVFNKRALPWERNLAGADDSTPWMALLLFQREELGAGDETGTLETTIHDILGLDQSNGVLTPRITPDPDTDKSERCQCIEITPQTFYHLVPRLQELKYLAHCRRVSTRDKAHLEMRDEGVFSVITGSRFPAAAKETEFFLHLVSLEGFESYLKDHHLSNPPPSLPLFTYQKVRLVSLAHWTFTSIPDRRGDFKELMENESKSMLKLPAAGNIENREVKDRIANGYVPLPYHLQTGENTFAWYRGPLSPVETGKIDARPHYLTASSAMIYNDKTGVFDQSLACAWLTGQNLALAGKDFAVNLLEFHREIHRRVDTVFERSQYHEPAVIGPGPKKAGFDAGELQKLSRGRFVREKFINIVDSRLAHTIKNIKDELPFDETPGEPGPAKTVPVSTGSDTDQKKELDEFIHSAAVSQFIRDTLESESYPQLEAVTEYLSRLYLLYDIPFSHLVPHPDLLPEESLRFFYIDTNWLDAAVDGALSIGIHSSRDVVIHTIIKEKLKERVNRKSKTLRNKLKGIDPAGEMDGGSVMSGFIMRSAVVSGWPGMEIKASVNGDPLQLLRMDRLCPDVLLCIFPGVPGTIEFNEPPEGLRFGLEGIKKEWRGNYFREGPVSKVLNTRALTTGTPGIHPADFAVRLIDLPQQYRFTLKK